MISKLINHSIILKKPLNTYQYLKYKFCTNSNDSNLKQNTSNETIPEIPNTKNQFIPNLYGIELKKHIFPHFHKKVTLSTEEIKFYQKSSPNYIIALVSKVIDEHYEPELKESTQISQDQDYIKNKFYTICTYCKVKYNTNHLDLEGLFRCKIEDIQKIEIRTLEEAQQVLEHPEKTSTETIHHQNEQIELDETEDEPDLIAEPSQQSNPYSISEILKKNMQRSKKPQQNDIYSLKVKKLEEIPLHITSRLEMKFKYLIDTYIKMHNTVSGRHPIIFNIIDLYKTLDHISNECCELHNRKLEVQYCLESIEPEERIDNVQKLLQSTINFTSYMNDIERAAQNSLRNKKFYEYYNEILKIAKQIVDGKKNKEVFLEKCTREFYEKNPKEEIKDIFENEKDKYIHLDENSMEGGVVKAYIEELSKIPYNVKSEEVFELKEAQEILDKEHYGMKEVKEAILEIIAVGHLKKSLKGKIFCFVGGPGLGKTTFAKSVAKALHRKFFNISLGGVSDSSVLKGHRRTYVGAYSGKIIEALKSCGTNNPVILLDEIDKMGSSSHGDPRSELLEILDPNQNSSFLDNFVDLPVDLSNVLFICSANYEQNISKPLLDRMDKVKLTSYTNLEKIEIFKRHLLPRAIEKTGVKDTDFSLESGVIECIVQDYCMGEPGVRYLEKNILRILEKVAYKIVTNEELLPIRVSTENLSQYLGNTYYRQKDHSKISTGVAISLGGGEYGGRLTYIEAFKKSHIGPKEHKRGLLFTGSLGNVFKEAMNISYSYARNFLRDRTSNTFLYENEVHIHAPDGAQKKEGATDSMSISTALISLALQKQPKKNIGLTGELTLHGKVLRTFGIKEKILVAKRERLSEVIIPYDNYADVEILGKEVKEGIMFHFVKDYQEVYDILFV